MQQRVICVYISNQSRKQSPVKTTITSREFPGFNLNKADCLTVIFEKMLALDDEDMAGNRLTELRKLIARVTVNLLRFLFRDSHFEMYERTNRRKDRKVQSAGLSALVQRRNYDVGVIEKKGTTEVQRKIILPLSPTPKTLCLLCPSSAFFLFLASRSTLPVVALYPSVTYFLENSFFLISA